MGCLELDVLEGSSLPEHLFLNEIRDPEHLDVSSKAKIKAPPQSEKITATYLIVEINKRRLQKSLKVTDRTRAWKEQKGQVAERKGIIGIGYTICFIQRIFLLS